MPRQAYQGFFTFVIVRVLTVELSFTGVINFVIFVSVSEDLALQEVKPNESIVSIVKIFKVVITELFCLIKTIRPNILNVLQNH